jgi:hypothetical protein
MRQLFFVNIIPFYNISKIRMNKGFGDLPEVKPTKNY